MIKRDGRRAGRNKWVGRACAPVVESLERRLCMNAADLDTTFGNGGITNIDFKPSAGEQADSVVVQPDGKVLIAGHIRNSYYSTLILGRYNSDGSLDTSFNGDGKESLGGVDGMAGLALTSGGKIVTAMVSGGYDVFRLNADGSRDATFGSGGEAYDPTHFSGFVSSGAVAVQSDGKVLIGGKYQIQPYHNAMGVIRLNADGSVDGSFGNGGLAYIDYDPNFVGDATGDWADTLSITVQGNGGIVVAGDSENSQTPNSNRELYVGRLNTNGSVDTAFGTSGHARVPGIAGGRGVVLATDGSIFLAGYDLIHLDAVKFSSTGQLDGTYGVNGVASYRLIGMPNGPAGGMGLNLQADGKAVVGGYIGNDLAVMRLTTSGQVDTSYGNAGFTRVTFSGAASAKGYAVAIQGDGKAIIAGGTMQLVNGQTNNADVALVRLTTAGALDGTWGNAGQVVTDGFQSSDDYATAIKLQSDGRILLQGYIDSPYFPDYADLARLQANGQLDTSFNGSGTEVVPATQVGSITGIAQRDGKIVLFGERNIDEELATRLELNGAIDTTTFGAQGVVPGAGTVTSLHPAPNVLKGVILADQRVLMVGFDVTGGFIARFNADGTLDTTFGTNGLRTIAPVGPIRFNDLCVQSDGRILLAYTSNILQSDTHINVARYNADGTADTSFGSGGVATFDPSGTGADSVSQLVVDSAGKIVIAGSAPAGGSTNTRFLAMRLTPGGALDASFGGGVGWTMVDFGRSVQSAAGVDLQANGKIVLAGSIGNNGDPTTLDMAAARLTSSGVLDTTFNGTGTWTRGTAGIAEALTAVRIQPDGRIVMAGYGTYGAHLSDFVAIRMAGDSISPTPFTVEAYGPYHVRAGQTGTLSAFAAPATGRSIVKYEWDLNYNGTTFNPTVNGSSVTFSAVGLIRGQRRNVALRVTDDQGNTAIDTTWVDVTNGAPTFTTSNLSLTPPAIDEGQSATLNGSFTDTEATDAHTVTIDWGDSSSKTVINLAAGVTGYSSTHQYHDDNPTETSQDVMPISVSVSDGIDTTTASTGVLVRNVAPTVSLGSNFSINEGSNASFFPTVTDPGSDGEFYLWHVTASNGQVIANSTQTSFGFKALDDGTYTVTLTVTDDDGGVGSATVTVTVLNVPPTITMTGKPTGFLGTAYPLTVTATDPGQDTISTWVVNWGDGSTDTYNSATLPALNHLYAADGDYTIKVTATDEDGNWSNTKPMSVVDEPYVDGDGVLQVMGGAGDDVIGLSVLNGLFRATVNSTTFSFDSGSVSSWAINAGGGNDTVSVANVTTGGTVGLGDGDDAFSFNGGSVDGITVLGGNGNDTATLNSGTGTFTFDGQAGSDKLTMATGVKETISTGLISGTSMSAVWLNAETVGIAGGLANDVVNVNFATPDPSDPSQIVLDLGTGVNTVDVIKVNSGMSMSVKSSGNDALKVESGAGASIAFSAALNGTETLTFNGSTSAADAFVLKAGSATDGSSTVTYTAGTSQVPTKIVINGNGGDDAVTVDWSGGATLASGNSIAIDGGTGNNTLTMIGSAGNDALTLSSTSGIQVVGNNSAFSLTISPTNIQSVRFVGGSGGNDSVSLLSATPYQLDTDTATGTPNVGVTVGSGVTATFNTDQHLASLTLNGGMAVLGSTTPRALSVGNLTFSGTGTVDIGHGKLMLTSLNGQPATAAAVEALVKQAAGVTRANGRHPWNGIGGITSSLARTDGVNNNAAGYAIGIADASDNAVTHLGLTTGQVIAKPAAYGDADLNNVVDIADLSAWNNGFASGNHWAQGDFNYDGVVDIADLSIWNNNFAGSVAPVGQSGGDALAPSASVPATTVEVTAPVNPAAATPTLETSVSAPSLTPMIVSSQNGGGVSTIQLGPVTPITFHQHRLRHGRTRPSATKAKAHDLMRPRLTQRIPDPIEVPKQDAAWRAWLGVFNPD